jgi:gliding motility-associated-like protein
MKSFFKLTFTLALSLASALCGFAQGDNPLPVIRTIGQSQTINCTSPDAEIGVEIDDWVSGFLYEWNTGQTDSIISVKPMASQTYILHISNADLGINTLRSFQIEVKNDAILVTESNYTIDKFTCAGQPIFIAASFSGGHAPYSFLWESGNTTPIELIIPDASQTVEVVVTDACGTSERANIQVTVEDHDPIVAEPIHSFKYDCVNDILSVYADLSKVSGGVGHGFAYTFSDWDSMNVPLQVEINEELEIPVKITDACGTDEVVTKIVFERNPIGLPKLSPIDACSGELVDITLFEQERLYFWDGNVMNVSYEVLAEGNAEYKLSYFDQCGDVHQLSRNIEISEANADFDYDVHANLGTVELEAIETDFESTYEWKANGEIMGTNPRIELFLEEGSVNEIELTVQNKNGCITSRTRTVHVKDNISIPTAFSPNADGKNDAFRLEIDEEFADFRVTIFDRWGQLVYESRDQYFAWEGTKDNNGKLNTYVYRVLGTTLSGELIDVSGTVTIVN